MRIARTSRLLTAAALVAQLVSACASNSNSASSHDDGSADDRADNDTQTLVPDASCMSNGCVRSLRHVGDFSYDDIAPYLESGVRIDNGYSIYVIEYVTNSATSLATIAIPYGVTAPQDGFHIIAHAHGSFGVDDACTLSGTVYGSGLAGLFGARGAIGVMTDYPGLGTPGVHPYLVSEVEGAAVLDSLRAARLVARSKDVPVSGQYAVAGLSQGGHATLSAAAMHQRYAPELSIGAFAAAAPGTVWFEHWRVGASYDGAHLGYHAMAMYAWANYYSYQGPSLWADDVASRIDSVMASDCAFDFGGTRLTYNADLGTSADEIFSPAFLAAYRAGDLRGDYAVIAQAFDDNRVEPYTQTAPLAIWQGDADAVVDVTATTEVVEALRAGGVSVDYRIVPGGHHEDVAFGFVATHQLRTDESIGWIFEQLDTPTMP